MRVRGEVTTEPFRGEGPLPAHAQAAADALRTGGLEPEIGPLGTTVEGTDDAVVSSMSDAVRAALSAGATRVSLQIEIIDA
ncbi:thiamine-binding protein [Flexivirga caeni]|uniref:Thiamine-binding protein domain-containing protein n=1 Tax=Flexivirga caeni TaxID=2294115 RepID=A0A3M9MFV4_9MICO|nr:thiamine-binding protein [Flexivirga caeni]RNI24440.1 hypothetical protein EFY87_05680 [Flexivirga caeni]